MNQKFVWHALGHTVHFHNVRQGKRNEKWLQMNLLLAIRKGGSVLTTGLEIRPQTEVPIFYSVPPLKCRSTTCLHSFFWVIPRRLNFMCRRFGTHCQFHRHKWCDQKESCLHPLWRWNWQSVPKRRHIKFRYRGNTQQKECNIQNTAKVWNPVMPVSSIHFRFLIHKDYCRLTLESYAVNPLNTELNPICQ